MKEEEQYAAMLRGMSDEEVRKAFTNAGIAFEYYGGHWAYRVAHDEMERRGLLR